MTPAVTMQLRFECAARSGLCAGRCGARQVCALDERAVTFPFLNEAARCCCDAADLADAAGLVCSSAAAGEQAQKQCEFFCCPQPARFCGAQCCTADEACGELLASGRPCCTAIDAGANNVACCMHGRGLNCQTSQPCCLGAQPSEACQPEDACGWLEPPEGTVLFAAALALALVMLVALFAGVICAKRRAAAPARKPNILLVENTDAMPPCCSRPRRVESLNLTSAGTYGSSIVVADHDEYFADENQL